MPTRCARSRLATDLARADILLRFRATSTASIAMLGLAGCFAGPAGAGESSLLGPWETTPAPGASVFVTFDGSETAGELDIDRYEPASGIAAGDGCFARSVATGTYSRSLDGSRIELVPTRGEAWLERCRDRALDTAPTPLSDDALAAARVAGRYELRGGELIVLEDESAGDVVRFVRVD
jgi:hypothetical protein